MPTIGVEIEMPVIDAEHGDLRPVREYFPALARIKEARGLTTHIEQIDGRDVAVCTDLVVSSLDNAFNNLESSIGPVPDTPDNLERLDRMINQELDDVGQALEADQAIVINFSEHPFTNPDTAYYLHMRTPKPIYDYWVGYRGWNHMAGIDAKAHNGPTTGSTVDTAIRGLNLMLGLTSVFIGLYANSPFEGGRLTGFKENRQTLWPRMFQDSRFACDRKLHGMPAAPFKDFRDYFNWMFGPGTAMQIVFGQKGGNYKQPREMLLVDGDPSALEFLRAERWKVRTLDGLTTKEITPRLDHLEFLQFSNFLDTRLRYGLRDVPDAGEFLEAMDGGFPLEEFFSRHAEFVYLEGRAAGANFPDRELMDLDNADIPASVVISTSAIQYGLLADLDGAERIIRNLGWDTLCGLRREAIKNGLDARYGGVRLVDLADRVLQAAGANLPGNLAWTLAYPLFVLSTRASGADRAIRAFESMNGNPADRLRRLTLSRRSVPLRAFSHS